MSEKPTFQVFSSVSASIKYRYYFLRFNGFLVENSAFIMIHVCNDVFSVMDDLLDGCSALSALAKLVLKAHLFPQNCDWDGCLERRMPPFSRPPKIMLLEECCFLKFCSSCVIQVSANFVEASLPTLSRCMLFLR